MAIETPIPSDPRFQDLRGRRFGRLVVTGYAGKRGQNHRWQCRCDCGNEATPQASSLQSGKTTSCGCYRRERQSEANTKHGHYLGKRPTRTYASWSNMMARTTIPSSTEYHRYAARGITICDRWRHGENGLGGFECFLADMGERPVGGATLDRRDNEQGYSPSNCRWATKSEQARNRRNSLIVTYDGITAPLKTICEIHFRDYELVYGRLKRGLTIVDAMNRPLHSKQRNVTA